MNIDREELFKIYMKKVHEIAEACDWKTSFGPEEIVGLIADILETNPELIKQ